jgi:HEAT repeat protein
MPIDHLIAALSAPAPDKRAEAAEQLAQLGPDAQPAAIALVLACGDEAEEVRQWATSALEELGPPVASDVSQLISLIEAKSPDVGYWAATFLGRLKAEAAPAVDALARTVGGQGNIAVRQRAAWALGEIGSAAAAATPVLQKAAGDPDPRLARLAAEALKKIAE